MRRLGAKACVGVVVGAVGVVSSSGCADNESTLFVVGVAKMDSTCTYTASGTAALLPRGLYDLGFNGSYQVGLILGNQMASRGQKSRMRAETSRIILEGAEVTLTLPDGSLFEDPFSAPGAGFVDVGAGEGAGYGVLSVVVVPHPDRLQDRRVALDNGYLIAEIKAFGKTLGGKGVESNVFRFPIEVCYGCLVTFPPSEMNSDGTLCLGSGSTEAATTPCMWGQDSQVVCSACAAAYTVCQDPNAKLQ